MRGRQVTVQIGSEVLNGAAAGIDADGALLLNENGQTREIVSGEVTLRPAG
jgi:biotin-(acetyl-CoA carboxylase) ligase